MLLSLPLSFYTTINSFPCVFLGCTYCELSFGGTSTDAVEVYSMMVEVNKNAIDVSPVPVVQTDFSGCTLLHVTSLLPIVN